MKEDLARANANQINQLRKETVLADPRKKQKKDVSAASQALNKGKESVKPSAAAATAGNKDVGGADKIVVEGDTSGGDETADENANPAKGKEVVASVPVPNTTRCVGNEIREAEQTLVYSNNEIVGQMRSIVIHGLDPSRLHFIRIRAGTEKWVSEWSETQKAQTLPRPRKAPRDRMPPKVVEDAQPALTDYVYAANGCSRNEYHKTGRMCSESPEKNRQR